MTLYGLCVTLHLLAMSLWLGHMFVWSLFAGPALKALDPPATAEMLRERSVYLGALGWPALTVLVPTGLYMLREASRPWPIWCTESVYADLTRGNPILKVLSHYCGVEWHRIDSDGGGFVIDTVPGVRWRALPVASKPAPYSPNRAQYSRSYVSSVSSTIAGGTSEIQRNVIAQRGLGMPRD